MCRKHNTSKGRNLLPQPLKGQPGSMNQQTGLFPAYRVIFIINLLFSKDFRPIFYLKELLIDKAVKVHGLLQLWKKAYCVNLL